MIRGTDEEGSGLANAPGLRRSLSLPLLVLYGMGTTVGAGIYALTGEIAGLAGRWAPLSFSIACVLAAFTALSYGELASRYPKSAGEAVYLRAGFGWAWLSTLGGFFVCLAGATSAATLSLAAIGYVGDLAALSDSFWRLFLLVGLVFGLGLIATWGISESVAVTALLTVVEVGGVLLVAVVGALWWGSAAAPPAGGPPPAPTGGSFSAIGVLSGAVLGFYAFLGFEDMVNVAEEVKEPRRNVPLGITITLVATGVLYLVFSFVAVGTVAPDVLAASEAPVTLIYATAGGPFPMAISLIAAAGMVNGILVQMIMGSRVLYGLAAQGAAPSAFAFVHPKTRTPVIATVVVVGVVLALVLLFPLERLARGTSWITLVLFALINGALFRLKGRPDDATPSVAVPRWIPLGGTLLCGALVLRDVLGALR